MSKEILGIEEFGTKLILTGDLDPIYIALNGLLPNNQTLRWLTAYFCFYNAGVACYLSEFENGSHFWKWMLQAAHNEHPPPCLERWPRGAERRHFRGKAAVKAVSLLTAKYPRPENFVKYLIGPKGKTRTFAEVSERVQEHYLFGSWISYKVADICERVLHIPISFSSSEVFMYKEPANAALEIWQQRHFGNEIQDPIAAIEDSVVWLDKQLRGLKAPPSFDRPVNIQEQETIFCKWKSQRTGYYAGKDIHEIRHGLMPWIAYSETAKKFLKNMPEEVNKCPKLW